ncbi:hypothetical protein [Flagellimonas sp.]|uniref:hypothetical protein n=1 Tax=Flagellimonas sp. TaxID=2058762 RepID=UPI003AB3A8CF
MKRYIKHFLIFLLIGSLILYFSSLREGMEVLKLEGGYFKNVGKTLEYFFSWVIPYWWYILIIASLILSLISVTILKRKK